jgi:hypothetical protein
MKSFLFWISGFDRRQAQTLLAHYERKYEVSIYHRNNDGRDSYQSVLSTTKLLEGAIHKEFAPCSTHRESCLEALGWIDKNGGAYEIVVRNHSLV